jgi:hypothetical protein
MYKKLMFLISLVVLLGLSTGARAEDLEVPWGETLIIDDYVEVGSFKVEGCIIITETGHLFSNGSDDRGTIDGDGTDGHGGSEYAQIIINGGQLTCQSRFNIGQDHDGRLIVNDGGYFSQECCGDDWDDGFKLPDDDGGEHFIIINDGEVHVHKFELRHDRHAKIELGCNGLLTIDECEHGDDREDPFEFYDQGDLYCSAGCAGPIISYVGDGAEAYCVTTPNEAWAPSPADDAINQKVGVVMTWKAGKYLGDKGKHFIYFGDDEAAIEAIPTGNTSSPYYRGYRNPGSESFDPADAALTLDLWETYFWRIDEFNKAPDPPETFTKGNVWSFATGCELPGDINLDCLVNFLDYAMLADDWGVEVLFPDDVTP